MKTVRIFSDAPLSDVATRLLIEGTSPHEVLFSSQPAASVLTRSEPDTAFGEADIAFGQPSVENILNSNRLRWVHLTSAGYTRYDTASFRAEAAARGLLVTNSSTVYAAPCALHAFAFMLAQARRLPVALGSRCENGSPEWTVLRNTSSLLGNQNVLILGFGAIATQLVNMLRPFDLRIAAFRRKPKGDESVRIVTAEGLPEALVAADHVVNLLPENADSSRFVSAERLALMKRGAVFYNIGRGATVDQEALFDALTSGHLEAAWLDVTDPEPLPTGHPLLSAPNCFITPHTAGGRRNESEALVRHFLDNFRSFLEGSVLLDRII